MWEQGTLIKIRGTEHKVLKIHRKKKLIFRDMCNPVHHYLSVKDVAMMKEGTRTYRGLSGKPLNTKTHSQLVEKKD